MESKQQHQPRPMRMFIYEFYPLIIVLIVVAVLFVGYIRIIDGQCQKYWLNKYHTLPAAQQQNNLLAEALNGYQGVPPGETPASDEALVDLALPEKFNFSDLAVQLDSLAENHNFKIISLENREAAADNFTLSDPALRGVDVSLELKGGSYDDFKNLLSAMEMSVLYLNVNGVSYQDDAYMVQLRTYYYQMP